MTDNGQPDDHPNTLGPVVRLFGVVLIILGTLNTMLSWRGGFEVLSLPVYLFAAGILLCVIGGVLRERAS